MESQRSFLVIGLLMVSFLLWQQWQLDYGPKPVEPVETLESDLPDAGNSGAIGEDVPASQSSPAMDVPSAGTTASAKTVVVNTDTFNIVIDTKGGDIVSADLVKFPVTQGAEESYSLLRETPEALYVAQSGLIGRDGPDASKEGRPVYNVTQDRFEMTDDQNELRVPLAFSTPDGLTVTKTFIFKRDHHDVTVQTMVLNSSGEAKQIQAYGQLKQVIDGPEGSMFMPTYRGAAYSTEEERYEKYSFDEIADTRLKETTPGGWVGMLEHYFVSAWVPPQDETNSLYSRILSDRYASIGFTGQPVTLQSGESTTLTSQLYMGPKDQDALAQLARGLDLTVDYGFLFFISQPLFKFLQWIHSLVQNWGLAIVIITVVVKGVMYPLTKKQYESMAKMRNLAPKMQQLKDRYGDDRQKMSQAMMEMYRKEKVNPMGGCFPLLLQMPIFLALYWVLLESVELRHADFFLWITDLSVKDPYFVLPVLTGASMYLLQKLQPMTIQDPMQQKIMQLMPVFMSVFFLWFPAGLVLYWFISNVITLVQAKMIYSAMEKKGLKTS